MTAKSYHDWPALMAKAQDFIREGGEPTLRAVAAHLKVPENTLRNAFHREYGVNSKNLATLHEMVFSPREEGVIDVTKVLNGPAEKVVDESDGTNERRVYSLSTDLIKTIDDLIRQCKIDTEEWIITAPEVRAWPVAMKLKHNEAGSEYHEAVVVQLYYVSTGRMVRRHPVAIEPVVQPVEIKLTARAKAAREPGAVRRGLVLADPQVGFRLRLHTAELTPFHDRRVLDIALQMLEREPFDDVFIIGDGLDMSEWSAKFAPEPEFFWTTQPALVEWAWWLASYRAAAGAGARIMYWEGNHDLRPETMLSMHMRAAYKLRAVDELQLPPALSVPKLLGLHLLDIEYLQGYPDNRYWINSKTAIEHGDMVRAGPGDTAKATVTKQQYTSIFGHIHRRELVAKKIMTRDGHTIHTAFCPGCACHIDGRVPGSTSDAQWQQGLGVVEYSDDMEHIIPVAIDQGRAIYRGELYVARERDGEIDEMLTQTLDGMV